MREFDIRMGECSPDAHCFFGNDEKCRCGGTSRRERRVAELQQEIDSQKHCYALLDEHREELVDKLAAAEKARDEAAAIIERKDRELSALRQELITANGKLSELGTEYAIVCHFKNELEEVNTLLDRALVICARGCSCDPYGKRVCGVCKALEAIQAERAKLSSSEL